MITGHREGVIIGPTIKSALQAIEYAQQTHKIQSEIIVVLDRPDALTKRLFESQLGKVARIIQVDEGDPGASRNHGVSYANGRYVAFLDADDLWSFNWLANAWNASRGRPNVFWHSECNVTFGKERCLWWHIDSEGALFDENYLQWGNYWDALSFGPIELYREFPFRPNDLAQGFGHEDWDWNRLTYAAGIPHKPVTDTIHFKRRRSSSQMSRVEQSDALVRPLSMPRRG
ncbi:glycosyltransferase family A protein [Methylobacterium sp. J-068]|uniref:glycosyltransferase family A protein n=1 Tax=Methylobacterium sp. J-068 TaxID=2836649 RepID=UPI001FBB4C4F|nr:glycosyltransferase family A protein [Methylobacterium sp. J-068]MCJ2032843.1 glycosyltransferase family 2 protein [Methylobacterium sp. J-068]